MSPRPPRPKFKPKSKFKPKAKPRFGLGLGPKPKTSSFRAQGATSPSASAAPGRRGPSAGRPAPPSGSGGVRRPQTRRGPAPPGYHPYEGRAPLPETLHIAPVEVLATAVLTTARAAEKSVFTEHRRADRAIAYALRNRRDLALPDHRFVAQAVFALFRWHGWIEGVKLKKLEERLLLAWSLDAPIVHPVCRVWSRTVGRDPSRIAAMGDAPSWTGRAEALKRWTEGRTINADPWRLFPPWLRDHLPTPPGGVSAKAKYLELLDALQKRPPLWVRAQGPRADQVWSELKQSGLNPWIHRRLLLAAKLDADADVYHLPAFLRGDLEIQDVASQLVGLVCDPDPGERWWDACAGAGGKALHLAALMGGKGVVVATDQHEGRLKEAARRARRSPFRNLTTRPWNGAGRQGAGKPRSFDGVLVDAPCSAIGTWRRNPDARWSIDADAIPRLAELQFQLLRAASSGVKTGGVLVYSVCTVTPSETSDVVRRFLAASPSFRLDPFKNPNTGDDTPGALQIWPQDLDGDAMYIARLIRVAAD